MTKRHTDNEVLVIACGIRDLLYKKWSEEQIRKEYGKDGKPMPQSTYYWYLKKIKEEDMKILKNHSAEQVPTEVRNLLKMLDNVIGWCEQHKDDEFESLKDRIAVQTLKMQAQAGKVQLLLQGPSIITKLCKVLAAVEPKPNDFELPWD